MQTASRDRAIVIGDRCAIHLQLQEECEAVAVRRRCAAGDRMNNRNLLKGVFLIAFSLVFGLTALRYPLGSFGRAGPGLFPVLVSGLLLLLGIASVIRALLTERVPFDGTVRNIVIVLLSLCGFALASQYVNLIAGIAVLVFVSTLAGSSYSVKRNLKITAVLIVIAFGFWKGLGLQLGLF